MSNRLGFAGVLVLAGVMVVPAGAAAQDSQTVRRQARAIEERQAMVAAQGSGTLSPAPKRRIESGQVALRTPGVRVPMEAGVVKGVPYSAELVIEDTQALADGNRIVKRITGRVYRDSEGRVRREEDREPGRVGSISVTDPVAGTAFSLDPESKTAWKTGLATAGVLVRKIAETRADPAELERRKRVEAEIAMAAGGGHAGIPVMPRIAAPEGRRGPDEKIEKLPARQIEGVLAEGTRITHTIPAGAIGNEQPIVSTVEEWYAPELRALVLTRTSDPRTGEHTYRLLNITRAEPNQAWFEIPADYTVRESGVYRFDVSIRKQ